MAENDPNGWAKAPGFNTWGHVGVAKDNAFYQLLDETKEKTDAMFEIVNLTFALVNSALDFIASLLIDFTNPLKPIIEEIIALLNSFIADLRNLGWYITWDKKEIEKKNPAETLLGGYPAFESRMVEKLLNLNDPTRPNFSPQSKVFAMTFFAGADASKLGAIIAYIKKLLKLFLSFKGASDKAEAPINVRVGYYNNIVGDIEIPNVYKPDGIRVKWNLPAPPSTNKVFPKTFILPDYFLFSVATRNADEKIAYINNVERSPTEDVEIEAFGPNKSTVQDLVGGETDPRLWPLINTDDAFTKLDESKEFQPLDETPDGIGTSGSFIIKGEDSYYLNNIDGRKISDVYRCFIYGGGGGGLVGDNDFSFDIPLEKLEIDGNLDSEYYITLYSLTIDSDDYNDISKTVEPLPSLAGIGSISASRTNAFLKEGKFLTTGRVGESLVSLAMPKGSLSKPSATVVVKSPSDIREKYLKAVKFYWLAHLLAQPYTPYHRNILGFDSPVGKELKLVSFYYDESLYHGIQTSYEFALKANEWLRKIMLRFKSDMPSDATLNSLKDSLDKINEFPLDLVEMMKDSATIFLDKNIYPSRSGTENNHARAEMLNANYDLEIYQRIGNSVVHDRWEGSKSPVVYKPDVFIGHLFLHKEFKETFRLAQKVVTLSPPLATAKGDWINQRPFRDADLSSLTNFIDTVKKYMEGFLKGLEGIVAQILKFIHMLKTRIAQVQAIIAKLKTLIDLILSFRFPAGLYGTFHLADGTAGLISALQQSEDKPDIGSGGYGTGAMVVAGGVPSILIDFFIALMGGEGEG